VGRSVAGAVDIGAIAAIPVVFFTRHDDHIDEAGPKVQKK
jgi:hypothetical protein